MAVPTLNPTPGDPGANVYVDRAGAESILADQRLYVDVWSALSDDDKDRSLLWSTFILDHAFLFDGTKVTSSQPLAWPRSGAVDRYSDSVDSDTIPPDIERACAVLALELAKRDRTAEPAILGQGFSEASVGSLDATVDRTEIVALVTPYVQSIVGPLGQLDPFAQPGKAGGVRELRRN